MVILRCCYAGKNPAGSLVVSTGVKHTFQLRSVRMTMTAAAFCTLAATSTARADIYSYVDAEGVTHYTNTRPKDASKFKLYVKSRATPDARSGGSSPAVAPQDRDPARYNRYDDWIRTAATLYQIPIELVRAVIKVESDYDARAVSYAGARGLMQLMPGTAERMQVKDIHDPRENIFGGVRYLRVLANTFHGDLDLTVAAYNAGEEAVMRHGGIPPFQQTREYVVRVTKYYRRYRANANAVEASTTPLD